MQELMQQEWFIFSIGFFGMISHFLKKYMKNQLDIRPSNSLAGMYTYFFKTDLVNTMLTIISYIVLFFVMYQMGEHGILTSFTTGYMSNSLFNKAEEKGLRI